MPGPMRSLLRRLSPNPSPPRGMLYADEEVWAGYAIRYRRYAQVWSYAVRDDGHAGGEQWLTRAEGFASQGAAHAAAVAALIGFERRHEAMDAVRARRRRARRGG